jgi:hypothetical protein
MTVESRRQVAPAKALFYKADVGLVDPVVPGYFGLASGVCQDVAHAIVVELACLAAHPAAGSSVSNGVSHVVLSRSPAEIAKPVVDAAAVNVAHIKASAIRDSERRQNKPVDAVLGVDAAFSKCDLQITVDCHVRLSKRTLQTLGVTAVVSNNPVFASYPAQVGHGIEAFVPEYGRPSFVFHGPIMTQRGASYVC